MREILFRGKTEDGKWVDGFYVKQVDCCGGVHFIFHCAKNPDDNNARYDVIKETVGQFTGLLDANGEKIFEGDILRERNGEDIGFIRYDDEDGMFYLVVDNVLYDFSTASSKWYEVIGNIHDNPELVEVAR